MQFTKEEILRHKKKVAIRKRIIFSIIYIIIIPIIVYNISLIVQSFVIPNKTPNFFGIKTYVIASGSMKPNLDIGDIIIIKEVSEDKIKLNDVISFREGQTIVTHRIVEIEETKDGKKYTTKGDNNNTNDFRPISYKDIEGIYINKIAKFGNFIVFLQNKIVIISVMLIFYLLYVYDFKRKEKSRIRKAKRIKYNLKFKNEHKDKI